MPPDDLPAPVLEHGVELPEHDEEINDAMLAFPARAGVLVFEDAHGATITIVTTADLRRRARSMLAVDDEPSRRADLRSICRYARATTIGSSFEADWTFLQLARRRLRHVYRSILDDWQAWFVHCNPDVEFPRWTKTPHASPDFAARPHESWIGPIPDKHLAARYREMLESAFDLCRYHHILVQAPHGAACAYKEMGRCSAPCDGTVSLEQYRNEVRASIEFARTPYAEWCAAEETRMAEAAEALDFEAAERHRRRLAATALAKRPAMKHAGSIEDLRYLAVMPSGRTGCVRLIVVLGGWIQPWADVEVTAERDAVRNLAEAIDSFARSFRPIWSPAAVENIAVLCRHLFREPKRRGPGMFLRLQGHVDVAALRRAIRSVGGADESLDPLDEQADLADPGLLA